MSYLIGSLAALWKRLPREGIFLLYTRVMVHFVYIHDRFSPALLSQISACFCTALATERADPVFQSPQLKYISSELTHKHLPWRWVKEAQTSFTRTDTEQSQLVTG